MVAFQYLFTLLLLLWLLLLVLLVDPWYKAEVKEVLNRCQVFFKIIVRTIIIIMLLLFLKHYISRVHPAPSLSIHGGGYFHSGTCITGFFVNLLFRAPTLFLAHMVYAEGTQKYEGQLWIGTWGPCSSSTNKLKLVLHSFKASILAWKRFTLVGKKPVLFHILPEWKQQKKKKKSLLASTFSWFTFE